MKLRPRHWKSLSSEITLVYASLSVTLVVLISFIGYRMNSRVLEERIRHELLQTVDQTLRGINGEINERVREVQTLTLDPSLRRAALEGTRRTESLGLMKAADEQVRRALLAHPDGAASAEASAFLSAMTEGHPYIARAFATDRYGVSVAASTPATDARHNGSTWWQEAVTQKFYLSNIEFDASAGSYGYSVALPIVDAPGRPIGVVKAVFNLKAVQDLVNAVRIGDGGYLVVLASDGTVLSHPDPRYQFRKAADVPDLAPVAALVTSSLRGVDVFTPTQAGNHEARWMVGYSRLMHPASLGFLNWTVVALVSRAEVVSPIISVRDSAVIAGLVFILAAVPIVFAVSKRLSRPLVDLSRRADRISTGELDVDLLVPSSNEIGQLARALASMVENLKASHRRTLDINVGLERTVRERTEELQRKNRQIEAQNKKVMEASRLKSQFLANMSHELRTPLNAVLALSEILASEMSGPLNEEQSKQITIVNRSGKALLRLINDVLDLSKIEAGRMSVEKAAMSLPSLVTLVIDTLRPLAEDKSLSLTSSLGPGVPEFITSDEHKLRQILINLIGNGIKFTERGGVTMEVTFNPKPAAISFRISDTGIGIPADSLDRIFEEFRQGDGSTTRKYGGTGLGLTISKKMAELMGGTLVVSSEPSKGSSFTLTVPYEPGAPVPATATETLRRVRMQVPEPTLMTTGDDSATASSDPRPIVLVAEDELDNLYIMKKYLNRYGCQVVFARDGNDVLQKARKYEPMAITLDLVLPKKNGWDVLAELKTDPQIRDIPVIVVSVLDNQERGFCLGAYRYLVKPLNETELADTIHQIHWAERKDFKRVLIIDDNVVDSDLLSRLLAESKYQVMQAFRGDEGIATAARERPDLIMLDLGMPEMDGFDVMHELARREETRDIPVIIHTARDLTDEEKTRLDRDGRKVFLKNPLEPARMLAGIGEVLGSVSKPRSVEGHVDGDGDDPLEGETAWWDETAAAVKIAADRVAAGSLVSTPGRQAAKRVLLVEDDPANQYTLEFMLKMEGYEVTVAENGREAIDKTNALRPDVILMDMMMPVMGGHEATRLLKDTQSVMDIPVIALTAAAMTGDREKALAAGCDDYVSKPVNREHLLERVAHWVTRAQEARRDESESGSTKESSPQSPATPSQD